MPVKAIFEKRAATVEVDTFISPVVGPQIPPNFPHNFPPETLSIFWGYFLPWKIFLFSEVIFRDPPKMPFKTSIKITSRGYYF